MKSEASPLKFSKQCTCCARTGICPSFPYPVGECLQFRRAPEAKNWWDSVNPRRDHGLDGD